MVCESALLFKECEKTMKKINYLKLCFILFAVCLVCCALFLFCNSLISFFLTFKTAGPDFYTFEGLSNYEQYSSMGTLDFLPNQEKIWEKYECIEGDFYYYEDSFVKASGKEIGILYVVFDESVYEEVKQFSLQHIEISEDKSYSYNGYRFFVDTKTYNYHTSAAKQLEFLQMTAFNDEKDVILFLGFYIWGNSDGMQTLQKLTEGDIRPFLEEYFPMYDFSK